MLLEVKTDNLKSRVLLVLGGLSLCALLMFASLVTGTVGLLSNQRANVSKELLARGIAFVPDSAALNVRLAEVEMGETDRDMLAVEQRAARAVNVSPWDYRNRLLLATVKEAQGDRETAELALRDAVNLAPNYAEVHWRLANLLIREGKLSRSVVEFRTAIATNPALLSGTLDLLWRLTAGNLTTVQAVTPREPKSQLTLANFLLTQSRAADAITVFSGIDRDVLLDLPDTRAFINSLVSKGRVEEARGLWVGLVSGTYAQPGKPLPILWNGGFETDSPKDLSQFDWSLVRNDYAAVTVDSTTAHSGNRSLRIDFAGRDTTKLDGQIKQTFILRSGVRYRLEWYQKTDRLETPEGPRIVVADANSSVELASSAPLSEGSTDWRVATIDFITPSNSSSVIVTVKRIPRFAYDKPTRGTIWFDDFVLNELGK